MRLEGRPSRPPLELDACVSISPWLPASSDAYGRGEPRSVFGCVLHEPGSLCGWSIATYSRNYPHSLTIRTETPLTAAIAAGEGQAQLFQGALCVGPDRRPPPSCAHGGTRHGGMAGRSSAFDWALSLHPASAASRLNGPLSCSAKPASYTYCICTPGPALLAGTIAVPLRTSPRRGGGAYSAITDMRLWGGAVLGFPPRASCAPCAYSHPPCLSPSRLTIQLTSKRSPYREARGHARSPRRGGAGFSIPQHGARGPTLARIPPSSVLR
jgi:hypothetical protein